MPTAKIDDIDGYVESLRARGLVCDSAKPAMVDTSGDHIGTAMVVPSCRAPVPDDEPDSAAAMTPWTNAELESFRQIYPKHGKQYCMALFRKTEAQIRSRASSMGLRQDQTSPFFKDWQERAAKSKVGKKRPSQREVMIRMHREGMFPAITAERRSEIGRMTKERIAKRGHPRGMLGKKHTEETKFVLGAKSRQAWDSTTPEMITERTRKAQITLAQKGTVRHGRKASWKAGWREVGGQRCFFRSRWEANYARLLEWRKDVVQWQHEPDTFWFDKIKRGCVSYKPDFKVTFADGSIEYHEVKGWMDAQSKTKIRRMRKYYPDVALVVVDSKAYRVLLKTVSSIIPGWEYGTDEVKYQILEN